MQIKYYTTKIKIVQKKFAANVIGASHLNWDAAIPSASAAHSRR